MSSHGRQYDDPGKEAKGSPNENNSRVLKDDGPAQSEQSEDTDYVQAKRLKTTDRTLMCRIRYGRFADECVGDVARQRLDIRPAAKTSNRRPEVVD